jgi:hypothetical protein
MSAPPLLTGDSSVSAVIVAFAGASDEPGERRELRSALSHVDAELGTMPIRAVRARHIVALLDELRAAGLSPRRRMAVTDALHSLFGFAVARGLVTASPLFEATSHREDEPPRRRATAPPHTEEPRTPTLTMVALGAKVAWWTALVVTIGFATMVLGLIIELA